MSSIIIFRRGVLFVCCSAILAGCAGGVQYRFAPPSEQNVVPVKGLPDRATVMEMVDRLGDDCAKPDSLILILKTLDSHVAYQVSVNSGEARFYKAVSAQEVPSYYWEKFTPTRQKGTDILGCCMYGACLGYGGHLTSRWGFEGERRFACEDEDRVLVSYQKMESVVAGGRVQESESGMSLKFVMDDEVIQVKDSWGYYTPITLENHSRIRYYLASDSQVVGCAPDKKGSKAEPIVVVYDLEKGASWGARMAVPEKIQYDDFAVSSNGALCVMLVSKKGDYRLLRYDAIEFSKAVKLFTARQ